MVGEISGNAGHQSVNISPKPNQIYISRCRMLSTWHDFRIVRDRKNLSTVVSTTRLLFVSVVIVDQTTAGINHDLATAKIEAGG